MIPYLYNFHNEGKLCFCGHRLKAEAVEAKKSEENEGKKGGKFT